MRNTTILAGLTIVLAGGFAAAGENLSAETLLPSHGETCAYAPAAAFGKDVYLVAWQTARNEKADIVGCRLDKSGRPLDAKPFVICGAKDCQSSPVVIFGGGVFLVLWQDLRNEKDWDIYAARVSPDGKVLDPDGVLVAGGPLNQSEPAACFDGRGFLVLFTNQLSEKRPEKGGGIVEAAGHVFGVRLSAECRPEGAPVVIAKPVSNGWFTPGGIGAPRVIKVGDGPVLAGAACGQRMPLWTMTEMKGTEKPVAMTSGAVWSGPRFATDGKNALAVWTTFAVTSGRTAGAVNTGMLFIPGGDPAKIPVKDLCVGDPRGTPGRSLSEGLKQVRNPSPTWDGKSYVVAWDITVKKDFRYDVVLLRRVSAAGEPEGKDEPVAGEPESPAFRPAAASDGAGTTIVVYERHPKTGDVPIKIGFRMLTAK